MAENLAPLLSASTDGELDVAILSGMLQTFGNLSLAAYEEVVPVELAETQLKRLIAEQGREVCERLMKQYSYTLKSGEGSEVVVTGKIAIPAEPFGQLYLSGLKVDPPKEGSALPSSVSDDPNWSTTYHNLRTFAAAQATSLKHDQKKYQLKVDKAPARTASQKLTAGAIYTVLSDALQQEQVTACAQGQAMLLQACQQFPYFDDSDKRSLSEALSVIPGFQYGGGADPKMTLRPKGQ